MNKFILPVLYVVCALRGVYLNIQEETALFIERCAYGVLTLHLSPDFFLNSGPRTSQLLCLDCSSRD